MKYDPEIILLDTEERLKEHRKWLNRDIYKSYDPCIVSSYYKSQRMNKIKYFWKKGSEVQEVSLDRNHMFYVQLDGSIRYAFGKHHVSFPESVLVTETDGNIDIVINVSCKQSENLIYVKDELRHQAEANSTDERTVRFIFQK